METSTVSSNQYRHCFNCFICLQKLTEEDQENYSHSLNNLLHHAQVTEQHVSSKDDLNKEWNLCYECSAVMGKFNALFRVFEEARLRLNQCFGEVIAVMKQVELEAERNCSKVDLEFSPLRRKLLANCLKTPNSTSTAPQPKPTLVVQVHQPENPEVSPAISTSTESDSPPSPQEENNSTTASTLLLEVDQVEVEAVEPNPDLESEMQEEDEETPLDTTLVPPLNPTVPDPLSFSLAPVRTYTADPLSAVTYSNPNIPKPPVICTYCSLPFSHVYVNTHYIRKHREHFLLDHKKEGVTPAQFKVIVDNVLFAELLHPPHCLLCGKGWIRLKTSDVRKCLAAHWIQSHLPVLVEKIVELQEKPEVVEKVAAAIKAREVPKMNSPIFMIPLLKFSSIPEIQGQPSAFPGATSTESPTVEEVASSPDPESCSSPESLSEPSSPLSDAVETPSPPPKVKVRNDSRPKGADAFKQDQCPHCKMWMHPASIKRHRNEGHCKALDAPNPILETNSFLCVHCNLSFHSRSTLSKHHRLFCTVLNPADWEQCPGCKGMMRPRILKRHLMRHEPCRLAKRRKADEEGEDSSEFQEEAVSP